MENLKNQSEMIEEFKKDTSTFCEVDNDECLEIIENALALNEDFEIGKYRFINKNDIDKIQQEELASDTYMLGLFNKYFIADIINIDIDLIEEYQKNEGYELLGELMLKNIEEVQNEFVKADGYGFHFAHYDHEENEVTIDGENFYVFKIG